MCWCGLVHDLDVSELVVCVGVEVHAVAVIELVMCVGVFRYMMWL